VTDENGILNIPGSYYFCHRHGIRKYVPFKITEYKIKKGIKKAAREEKIFHIYFHLHDFILKKEEMLKTFEKVIKWTHEYRKNDFIEILTMKDIYYSFKNKHH
jgi:hypothetical protein